MSRSSPDFDYRDDYSLGIGQIVGDAFNVSLKTYIGIFFLNLPILILTAAAFGADSMSAFSDNRAAMEQMIRENTGRFFGLQAAIFVIAMIASCAMTRVIFDRYVGSPVSMSASAASGARRTLPVLGLLLIVLLIYVVVAFAIALVTTLLQFALGVIAVLLALVAVVFCLYLAFPYLLSGIVCVDEELGPVASLGRSKYLTDGYRWPLLGLLLIGVLIMAAYQVVVMALNFLLAPAAFGSTILLVAVALAYPLLGGWLIGLFVIAAHRLRAIKDGSMSNGSLAKVFE